MSMPTSAEVTAALIVFALGVIFVIVLATVAFLLTDVACTLLDVRDRHSAERDWIPADLALTDRFRCGARTLGERQHTAAVTELYPETGRQVRRLPGADVRRDGAA